MVTPCHAPMCGVAWKFELNLNPNDFCLHHFSALPIFSLIMGWKTRFMMRTLALFSAYRRPEDAYIRAYMVAMIRQTLNGW
jgi:hypothetical protein